MISRWWASIQAGSLESKRRELRAIRDELRWLAAEQERLAERRDELMRDLRPAAPSLRVVSR